MVTRSALICAALLLALAWGTASAHEGHTHTIMGTVMDRDAHSIQVKTPGGETLSIALTENTVVVSGKQKATVADVKKGRRVVVDIGDGEDPLIARALTLGAAPAKETK
jgi:hypothetical protein